MKPPDCCSLPLACLRASCPSLPYPASCLPFITLRHVYHLHRASFSMFMPARSTYIVTNVPHTWPSLWSALHRIITSHPKPNSIIAVLVSILLSRFLIRNGKPKTDIRGKPYKPASTLNPNRHALTLTSGQPSQLPNGIWAYSDGSGRGLG